MFDVDSNDRGTDGEVSPGHGPFRSSSVLGDVCFPRNDRDQIGTGSLRNGANVNQASAADRLNDDHEIRGI